MKNINKPSRNVVSCTEKTPKQTKKSKTFRLSDAKKRLSGSRFRNLNELLYTSTSQENFMKYSKNPELFLAYHQGYREQTYKWPYNPVNVIIQSLAGLAQDKVIGDFGCGEALIAQAYPERKVFSFDLVAANEFITACNISKVPIKDDSLDVAIFCLSLMGLDWPTFILEATRCLKEGGTLHFVEVRSRFTDVSAFIKFVESFGYKTLEHDNRDEKDFFIFMQFQLDKKKLREESALSEGLEEILLPCPYKRR